MPEPLRRGSTTLPPTAPIQVREVPVTELLLQKAEFHDQRPLMVKHPQLIRKVDLNKMYGTLRTENGWRYIIDNFAKGTVTTIANQTVSAAVALILTPNWRLEQWPGATQMFLVIRQFALSPQTATFATAGTIDIIYQDTIGGQQIPLGDMLNNASLNSDMVRLIPTPITDPNVTAIGNLLVTLNTGATVGVYNWQLSFSGAYLLPSLKGYSREERIERLPKQVHS